MLDINFIRENSEAVKQAVSQKGIDVSIDQLLEVDQKRRELLKQVEQLREERNKAATERNIERGKEIKIQLEPLETELKEAQERLNHLMLYVPNIPSPDSPVGADSDANVEIAKSGELPQFDFPAKDHIALGKSLGILDLEQGAKVSGFRGYYLKNEGARLHWAVLNYALKIIQEEGFNLVVPPTLVHEEVLVGSGHFPFGKDNIYQIANPGKLMTGEDIQNPLFLTGTSEPSLLALYLDKTINEADLPIKVAALTQCYRSEVGDYGKDTKGLYRVHEFTKVEQVIICKAALEESEEWFKKMQSVMERLLSDFGLPYRVIKASTGDMGAGKYRMNDVEVWMPGRNKYGEICSNSNLTDWQARRLNLKYKSGDKNLFAYTLNSTVMPSPRILIALLENHQQADGSVLIPEALRSFTGFDKISPK